MGLPSLQQSPENFRKSVIQGGMESERKWLQHVKKIYIAIHSMDKNKYLEPKFSMSLYPVIKYLYKKYGAMLAGGSTVSNITMLSQSQRGGGPPGIGILNSNFNDSYSLSSLISADTQNKKASEISAISGPQASSSNIPDTNCRLVMLMNDQKTSATFENAKNNNFSVIEQSIEDDEEEKSGKKANIIMEDNSYFPNKGSIMMQQPVERSHSEVAGVTHSGFKVRIQETSPTLMEPILKGKQTTRTLQGGLGRQSLLMAEGLEQFLRETPQRITDTVYQDRKDNKRGTPKKNTSGLYYKKKYQSRAIQNQINSYNAGGQMSTTESQSMMESAYKTSYSFGQKQSSSQIMRNINIQQSSSAYGQFAPNSGNNTSAYQSRKGQKFIKTLIEQRVTSQQKSTVVGQQRFGRNKEDFNKDMNHMKSLKSLQHTMDAHKENAELSPDAAVAKSYYIQKPYPTVDESTLSQGRSDSSRQYSAISVKRVSMLEGNKSEISGGATKGGSFMNVRNEQKKRSDAKEISKNSSSLKTGRRNLHVPDQYTIASLAFENVYLEKPQQQQPKIALQVMEREKSITNQDDNQSSSSQRSLQKNYLQNLNELVKIHQEMKKQGVYITAKQQRKVK